MKKLIITSLFLVALLTSSLLIQPKQTNAFLGIGDIVADPVNIGTNIVTTGETIWSTISKEVLEPLVKTIADKVLDKLVQDTLSWANGGFDGEPGFVNNWDEFLKGTQHEVISNTFSYASNLANENGIPLGDDPYGDAQNNYNNFISGNDTYRFAAQIIAEFGVDKLADNDLERIINGDGETLINLLGSKPAKDLFFKDLTANQDSAVDVLHAYISAPDANNTKRGINTLLTQVLEQEVIKEESKVVQDIQTPQKFLNKTECTEYAEDGSCTRKITKTPGNLVGGLVQKGLQKDGDQAVAADGLIGSLVKAIGDLTDGLISVGLSELSGAATNAFFGSNDTQQFIDALGGEENIYQSEYDVLGIQPDGSVNGNPLTGPNTSGGGNFLGGDIFIGGPEDIEDGQYGSAQIVIDLQKQLDVNLLLLEEEKSYYDGIRDVLGNSADLLLEYDKCIPGPDYEWSRRYKDVLSTSSIDEEGQINAIGLNETKNMTQDSLVTIPGGVEMLNQHKGILRKTQDESIKNKIRIDKINSALSTLTFIKQQVITKFNEYKGDLGNPNLVLFERDWDGLSQAAKENALLYAYTLNYYNSQTAESLDEFNAPTELENFPDKTRNAVITASWWLWRTQTDTKEKLDLRKAFYVTQNDLSNEQFIAIAEVKFNQLKTSINQSYESAADCMTLKLYALGVDRGPLAEINFGEGTTEDHTIALANALYAFEPGADGNIENTGNHIGTGNIASVLLGGVLGGIFGGGGSSSSFADYVVTNARTDAVILDFVEAEYALQNDGNNNTKSVFKTLIVTSPAAVLSSILGFESETQKEDYFNLYYPDDDFPYTKNKNKLSLKEMYRVDRVYGNSNRVSKGMHGFLFCRNKGDFEIINVSGGGDTRGTNCWRDFYSATKLDYELLVSGINN